VLRRVGKKLFLSFGCVLVALAGLEVGLRAMGSLLVQRQTESARASTAGVTTILCVGDSWTQGAPYGRYPDNLIERLNRLAGQTRFRQVNVGRAGTNSSQTLRRLADEIAAYRPDLLLVLTGNNDHHNLTDSTYWRFRDETLGELSILGARARAFAHSLRVYRLGRTVWQKTTGRRTPNEFFEAGDPGETDHAGTVLDIDSHHRQLEYNLTRLLELSRRENVPVVFQTYFHFHGYRVNEIVREFATRHDLPLVDHNRLFHTAIPAARRPDLLIEDGHPNAGGYALMADNVLATLEQHDLIPRFEPGATPAVRFPEP
jgi:lysophospholipase L1-like esterase